MFLMLILDVKHLVVLILSTLYTLFPFHIVYVKKSAQSTFGNMEKYSVYFYSTLYHISLQVALIVHFFYILYILTLVLSFGCFLCLELVHMLKKLTLHSLKMQYAFNW